MEVVFDFLEKIIYTEILGKLNLYTLFSTILKYIFVVIVLRFVYLIVRMIYLDISQMKPGEAQGAYIHLLNPKETLQFHVQSEYYLQDSNVLGRDRSCDIPIDYIYLSKEHARIFKQGDDYYIEDLQSANGTEVNGQEIHRPVLLQDKDLVSFVKLNFIFMKGEDDELQ